MTNTFRDKRIRVSVETIDADGNVIEQHMEDELGTIFDNILEAASWLSDEGAISASASTADATRWFSTEGAMNFKTGETTTKAYHPVGYTEAEMKTLFYTVEKMLNLGNPLTLDYRDIDDWEKVAAFYQADENGIIQSPRTPFTGAHVAVAYIDGYAPSVKAATEALKEQIAKEAETNDDVFPGQTFFELSARDAVYFKLTDRPVLVASIKDGSASYEFMSRDDLVSQAAAMKADNVNRPFGR